MNKQLLSRIAWGVCIVVGIVLSLKALREPDLWWMYRTGEWMLENGQVTKSDPFSYTFAGVEWINVKWLFEILIVMGKGLFGVEFIFILQAIVTVSILTIYYQSANLIKRHSTETTEHKKQPFAGLVIVGLLLLYTIDFRLIGRPEMTSHLMVSIYLFLFWKFYYEPSKLIFALIPLQILWANMHEAYGIGMVLMLAYLGATWVQFFYHKKKASLRQTNNQAAEGTASEDETEEREQSTWKNRTKTLSLAVFAALAAVVLNPRGIQMLWHPFEIYGQLASNQFTTELAPIWKASYWENQAYLNLFFLGASLLFVLLSPSIYRKTISKEKKVRVVTKGKKKKAKTKIQVVTEKAPLNWFDSNVRKYGMGNGLLYFMLFYLSITAYRNIPFFIIAAAPILAVAVDWAIEKINYPKWSYPTVLGLGIVFYISIITGKYHEWSSSRDQYGLQVISSHNPIGAADFIAENKIEGRCFSDFLTSSYLLWKLQPDFKTYIDLRDLDIFPAEFFNDFAKTTIEPAKFEAKDDSLKFDYVVLFRPQFPALHQHLILSSEYELVFVDPVACVYLKNNSNNEGLIAKYGFVQNGFRDIFSPLRAVESSSLAYLISKIFNPLYSPIDYTTTDENTIAGYYYLNLNHINLAFDRAKASIESGIETWKGSELMGNIYNNLAFGSSTVDSLRKGYIAQASFYYRQALATKSDYLPAIIGQGTVSMQQHDLTTAIQHYNHALAISPNYAQAIKYLGMCYKVLSNQSSQPTANTQLWLDHMLHLNRLNPNNPSTLLDIGIAYCTLRDCQKSVEYLKNIMKVPGLPTEEFKTAVRCMKNCGG